VPVLPIANRLSLLLGHAEERRCHNLYDGPLSQNPVEPGSERASAKISRSRGNKKAACAAPLPCRVGDPQTYALLHCSVFKERTHPPSLVKAGSLTTPARRGVRVTAIRLSFRAKRVKGFGQHCPLHKLHVDNAWNGRWKAGFPFGQIEPSRRRAFGATTHPFAGKTSHGLGARLLLT
jgi:hypothetical protein